ncbi:MAG TPA: hypothetical protein VLS45_09270 [Methylomicrobium sp.]|nr:hypothetical protein [Methylomicrobium sp.]
MKRKYHMHDQVKNKIEDVMNHYHRPMMDLWLFKLITMGGCFMLGVYWQSLRTILG